MEISQKMLQIYIINMDLNIINSSLQPHLLGANELMSQDPVLMIMMSQQYAQPITGQVTEVTCPVIGQAQPELSLSKRQKIGPGNGLMLQYWQKSMPPHGVTTVKPLI